MRIENVAHGEIAPDPSNPNTMPEHMLRALADEIRLRGFVQPLLVREVADDPDGVRYRIVDGEQRWRVLGQLGAETVPCVVEGLGEDDARVRMLTMNRLRGRFVPLRLAHLLADLSQEVGESETAGRLALSRDELRGYLATAGVEPEPKRERPTPPSPVERERPSVRRLQVTTTAPTGDALGTRLGSDPPAVLSDLASRLRRTK